MDIGLTRLDNELHNVFRWIQRAPQQGVRVFSDISTL